MKIYKIGKLLGVRILLSDKKERLPKKIFFVIFSAE